MPSQHCQGAYFLTAEGEASDDWFGPAASSNPSLNSTPTLDPACRSRNHGAMTVATGHIT